LLKSVIPRRQWPTPGFKQKRAIREWLQKHHALWVAAQEPLTE
jgi:hypothetical protein